MEGLLSTGPTLYSFLPFEIGNAVKAAEDEYDSVSKSINGLTNNDSVCRAAHGFAKV